MLDMGRLRALHGVHAHGSVGAATAALGYTPSAVSQQIAKLERETKTVLLERQGRGVAFTDAAQLLVATVQEAGLGIALVPRLGRGPIPEGVSVLPLPLPLQPSPVRRLYALWREGAARRPSIGAAVDTLRAHWPVAA